MIEAMVTRACSRCGTTAEAPDDGIPDGWSYSTDRRRIEYTCPDCVRANIRSIEGKLPEEYWEY